MNKRHLRIGVAGASGRMGQQVVAALKHHKEAQWSAAWVRPERLADHAWRQSLGTEICVTDDAVTLTRACDVVIDFVAPSAVRHLAPACAHAKVGYVVATTGLTEDDQRILDEAAQSSAVLEAANFSLGINLLLGLVEQAAKSLRGWDIEIVEAHHRHKRDAPSGTALALGKAIERSKPHAEIEVAGPERRAPRPEHSVGISVVRAGDIVGEHTVMFAGASERLELSHRAHSPALFAEGAIAAAQFIADAPAGRWSMRDVLAASSC